MQSKISVPLLSALSSLGLAFAQIAPVPLPDSAPGQGQCGSGCYVVAGVAGIVFGAESPAQQVNGGVVASNSTITTTFTINQASFTISPSSGILNPIPSNIQGETMFGGPTLTISGQTLTSPTAYNIFTAYSTTRTSQGANGVCSLVLGTPIPINPPFIVTIPTTVTDVAGFNSFQLRAESSFFASLGYPDGCSAGGVSFLPTTVVNTTTATTTINITTTLATPQPAVTVSTTSSALPTVTANTTTSAPGVIISGSGLANGSSFTVPSSGQSVITINPTAGLSVTSTDVATQTNFITQAGGANRQSSVNALLSGVLAMIVGFIA